MRGPSDGGIPNILEIMSTSHLLIPVYLNQRTVFDLLAMMQDGLSHITRLSSTEASREVSQGDVKSTFGLANALSGLLRVDLSASAGRTVDGSELKTRSEDRVHTPASLLFKLRQMLVEKSAVSQDSAVYKPTVGEFVEFTTTLRRNPLIESMNTMLGMIDMWSAFVEQPSKGKKGTSPGFDFRKLRVQMEAFRDGLMAGGTVDIIGESLKCGHDAVITLEEAFLSDPTMSDLVDGRFTVLAKIVRVVPEQNEAISLIRKTAVGAMSTTTLTSMFSSFETAAESGNFRLPKPRWDVGGPAFQVLPIAIYA